MIEHAIIIAMICLFWWQCTQEGMIFEQLNIATWDWPEWIRKPLFSCPICSAMWIGQLVAIAGNILFGWTYNWFQILFLCMVAGGINTVVINMTNGKEDTGGDNE